MRDLLLQVKSLIAALRRRAVHLLTIGEASAAKTLAIFAGPGSDTPQKGAPHSVGIGKAAM